MKQMPQPGHMTNRGGKEHDMTPPALGVQSIVDIWPNKKLPLFKWESSHDIRINNFTGKEVYIAIILEGGESQFERFSLSLEDINVLDEKIC